MSASNVPNTTNLPPIWNVSNWTSSSGGTGTQGPAGPEGATGSTYQFTDKIFLGSSAGTGQGTYGIAIGVESGVDQDINSIGIGRYACGSSASAYTIGIGTGALRITPQQNAIGIGNECGTFSAGENSLGLGSFCGGVTGIHASSIVLNASGNFFTSGSTGLYIKPIRGSQGNTSYVLGFNDSTNEITYESSASFYFDFATSFSSQTLTDTNVVYACCSETGQCQYIFTIGGCYVSTNWGISFSPIGVPIPPQLTYTGSCSANGQYVVAERNFSNNYGGSFSTITPTITASAVSGNGQYVLGVEYSGVGDVYVSSDFGVSYTNTATVTVGAAALGGVSVSGDGQYMVIAGGNSSNISISDDYGLTWTTTATSNNNYYNCISASGQYIYYTDDSNNTYKSDNYGASFTNVNTGMGIISCSSSGKYIVVGQDITTGINTSSDYGNNWTTTQAGSYTSCIYMSGNATYVGYTNASGNLNISYNY